MKKYIIVILLMMWAIGLEAQNRIIVNPGFNSGSNLPETGYANVESQLSASPEIDGWYTTHSSFDGLSSPIEVWCDGFNGTPSQEGTHFVELNANEPSRLYQIVYLVNGEYIDWEYYHRNRPGGLESQTIKYSIYSEDGSTELYVVDSYSNATTTSWTRRHGTFAVPLSTGIYQIGFESTEGTSYGNLLDNVTIVLDPLVEFASTYHETTETEGVVPHIVVNGKVDHLSTVTVKINSATASSPSDFTYSSLTVNVPAGRYGLADSIPVPFYIVDDEDVEGDETIEFEIVSVTGDLLQQDADGIGSNETTCSFKIIDDDFLLINLTKFELRETEKLSVLLNWESSSEINSKLFEVQKSLDTKAWECIASIVASGNSNNPKTYTFEDKFPADKAYYRLKQVDLNGAYKFSRILEYQKTISELKFYPNPAQDYITIESKNTVLGALELYDLSGQIVKQIFCNSSKCQMEISHIPKGIYYIKIEQKTYPLIIL